MRVPEPTVIAVDWSGARRPRGIWIAVVRNGELAESLPASTRESAIAFVAAVAPPVVAGFDFSFSVPAWFAAELGATTVDDVWDLAAKHGDTWLAPTPPFWRDRNTLAPEKRFRRCERRFPSAKSIFQLVGNGQVGPGSVRGMPLLRDLRASGFAIWPFDPPAVRTAFEIYPRALRPIVTERGPFTTNDERDAVSAAFAIWEARASVAALAAATDPVTRIEGDVWMPPATPTASPSAAR